MSVAKILVDTNIFLDVLQRDPVWLPWSVQQLRLGQSSSSLVINIVIYAELLGHPKFDFDLDTFLQQQAIDVVGISRKAARAAAMAFREYRQRGGSKTGVLPDFFIGAQAQAEGWTLLTRDAARYKTYFPDIQLICPA